MSTRTQHVWEFVETLTGPIVFVGYFGLSYLWSSLGCTFAADPTPLLRISEMAVGAVVAVLTAAALVILAVISILAASRILHSTAEGDEEDTFLACITFALAGMSAVAVVWTGVTAASIPLCV
jgi:hypothetical protein